MTNPGDLKNSFPPWALLALGLIPPALVIMWGELSEFNIDLWILPTVNVPPNYLVFEQFLIGTYYLLSPGLILVFLRKSVFPKDDLRFLILAGVSLFSYGLLRYAEFVYDTGGPSVIELFGNLFPLVFWSLPLVATAAAAMILSAKS